MRTDIMEQARAIRKKMDENQKVVDMVAAAGGITATLEQSDKLGFDWRVYAVNNVVVRKEYVRQAHPVGTADNPIVWAADTRLIPNGCYTHDGTVKVWMGEAGVTADWNNDAWTEL